MAVATLCKFICWIITKLPSLLLCLLCPIITCLSTIIIKVLKAPGAVLLALIQLICCVVKCCIETLFVFVLDCVLKAVSLLFSTLVVAAHRVVVDTWSEFVELMVYVWFNILEAFDLLVNFAGELKEIIAWVFEVLMEQWEMVKDYIEKVLKDIDILEIMKKINQVYKLVVDIISRMEDAVNAIKELIKHLERVKKLIDFFWKIIDPLFFSKTNGYYTIVAEKGYQSIDVIKEVVGEITKELERLADIVEDYRHYIRASTPVVSEAVSRHVDLCYNVVNGMVFQSLDAVATAVALVEEIMLVFKEAMELMVEVLKVVTSKNIYAFFDLVVDVFGLVRCNRYLAFPVILMVLVTLLICYQWFRNRKTSGG
ncbi:uncharacterized protein LOC143631381 [Bidens hawaiensis]|uniref:uncharacterized protein LOC143631381 n=1 Tax=Bidens hawaiensis TaxID=980011 RepID=UPI0040499177